MTVGYLLSFILFTMGIIILLQITPDMVVEDFLSLVGRDQSYADRKKSLEGKKKTNRITIEIKRIRNAMIIMGKEKQFARLVVLSLVLLVLGCVVSIMIGNIFIMPIMAITMAVIPVFYAKKSIEEYDKQMKEELETALSVITTSYVRNDDIVKAVFENMQYLKSPVKNVFEEFYTQNRMVSPDVKESIRNMKSHISDVIFAEWCDTLISCQEDRTLKDTLMPIVSKYTDVRIVNNEIKPMLNKARFEYSIMAAMVIISVPVLKVLNADWYGYLIDTVPGKCVISICAFAVLYTAIRMNEYIKPVDYSGVEQK